MVARTAIAGAMATGGSWGTEGADGAVGASMCGAVRSCWLFIATAGMGTATLEGGREAAGLLLLSAVGFLAMFPDDVIG